LNSFQPCEEKPMNAALIAQQLAPLPHLLRAAGMVGWVIVALGLTLTAWGVINLLKRTGPTSLVLQSLCSLIPAVLAMAMAGAAYAEFVQIATAAEPPRPNVFADLIARGLFAGMIGPLASAVPAALGIAALARMKAAPDASTPDYQHT
jgi:hypothetical protein